LTGLDSKVKGSYFKKMQKLKDRIDEEKEDIKAEL
jgi:hypothetical protein